jgi:hypothetical protein
VRLVRASSLKCLIRKHPMHKPVRPGWHTTKSQTAATKMITQCGYAHSTKPVVALLFAGIDTTTAPARLTP